MIGIFDPPIFDPEIFDTESVPLASEVPPPTQVSQSRYGGVYEPRKPKKRTDTIAIHVPIAREVRVTKEIQIHLLLDNKERYLRYLRWLELLDD